MLGDYRFGKCFQNFFFGNITYIVITGDNVNDADCSAVFFKLFCNTLTDAGCPACDPNHFVLKHNDPSLLSQIVPQKQAGKKTNPKKTADYTKVWEGFCR